MNGRRFPARLAASAGLLAAASLAALLAGCAAGPARTAGLRPALEARGDEGADTSPYGLFLAGQAAIDAGSSRDAATYFGRASAEVPDAGDLKSRAFSAALLSGDIDRAAILAPGEGEGGASVQGLSRLVRAVDALANGHGKLAEAALAQEAPSGPHRVAATLLRPWAAAQAGDVVGALAPLTLDGDGLQAFAALAHAQLLERAGELAEAKAVYRGSLADKSGVFALAHGAFLERRGRRPDAIALYDKALAKTPDDPAFRAAEARAAAGRPAPLAPTVREGAAEALIGPAALMLAQREGEIGLTYLRLALKLDPTLSEAWVLVGDAMAAGGDPDSARDAYDKVKPTSPEYTTARGRLALLLQEAGEKDRALALARATVEAAPNDPPALLVLADLLREDEKYDEAAAVVTRLIDQAGAKADWRLYYLRGASEERAGHWDRAEPDLKRALAIKPEEPEILNYLGYAWVDRGEHLGEALGMLQKATELQPQSGAIVDSLGWARYRLRDYPAAVRELERAASLDPADPEVNSHLGDAYWRSGRRLEATYQWRRVLTLEPDAKMRAAAEARLQGGLAIAETAPRRAPDATPAPARP